MAGKTISERFQPRRVAVLAFDGVVLGDLSVPCELFGRATDAQGRALYEVRVCAEQARVRSRFVGLEVERRLAWASRADVVIVPGTEHPMEEPSAPVVRAIRRAVARGTRVASICTGAFALAASGALEGLRATTHWMATDELARRYPGVRVDPSVLYVDHGTLLTSAGATAGVDLCLHLIRRDFGARIAAQVARASVVALERSGGQSQFIERPMPPDDEGTLAPVLAWLDAHPEAELTLASVAKKAGLSTRSLSRHFRDRLGTTPGRWIAQARVRRAQRLLETTSWPIARVADEVGLGSAAVLRRHFAREVGTSPLAWRRLFRR